MSTATPDPPALTLRNLIVENGGSYHHYYFYGKTTYVVASALSKTRKWSSLRANEKVIRPEWIVKCIEKKQLVPEDEFLFMLPTTSKEGVLPANTVKISEFYSRSRLHLISTLAQDMKTLVSQLRQSNNGIFPSRARLDHLKGRSGSPSVSKAICHLDMDCFFVAVALRSRPDLVGKPVAITHSKNAQGKGLSEISSCSYEARAFNVSSGMLVRKASELCPHLVCVPYADFEEYRQLSKIFYTTVASYTVDIKAISCDEMYIDLSDLCREMNIFDPLAVVSEIRKDVFEKVKCRASAGIGSSLLLARLATRKSKPNGQHWIQGANVSQFMQRVKVRDLPGVGYATMEKLRESTGFMDCDCLQLQSINQSQLQSILGQKLGAKLFNMCRGVCSEEFEATGGEMRKSVSCDINFGVRLKSDQDLVNFLTDISHQLALKMDGLEMRGGAITLKLMIRCPDAPVEPEKHGAHGPCNIVTRSSTLRKPISSQQEILKEVMLLSKQLGANVPDVRGIGVQMTRLSKYAGNVQPSLQNFLGVRKVGDRAKRTMAQRNLFAKPGLKSTKGRMTKEAGEKVKRFGQLPTVSARASSTGEAKPDATLVADWLESLSTSNNPAPTREAINKLRRIIGSMGEQLNFYSVKSAISRMERYFLNSVDMESSSKWMTAIAALKSEVNEECVKKCGAKIFR